MNEFATVMVTDSGLGTDAGRIRRRQVKSVRSSLVRRRSITAFIAGIALVVSGATVFAQPAMAAGSATKTVAQQAKKVKTAHRPDAITKVSAKPGSKPGTAVVSWKTKNRYVSYFVLELASTTFSKKLAHLPNRGLNYQRVKIPRTAKRFVISAKLAAKAGVPVGSANPIFFRLSAVNTAGKKKLVRDYPYLQAIHTAAVKPAESGILIRYASFNVASAKVTARRGLPSWLKRKDKVAANILASGADVIMLQELGPGNEINGGSLNGDTLRRQTESLEKAVQSRSGGSSFRLVKRNAFKPARLDSGSQGTRILYNSARLREISHCSDTTWSAEKQKYLDYSADCTITLPRLKTDSLAQQLRATYALFEDRATGSRFWAVSAHLDHRRATSAKKAYTYDRLRAKQAKTIIAAMNKVNTAKYPVLFGGDINISPYNQRTGALPHRALLKAGYYDSGAALKRKGVKYPTTNQWRQKIAATGFGYGPRLDLLMTQGIKGAVNWANTMKRVDANRESDHALVYATIRIGS